MDTTSSRTPVFVGAGPTNAGGTAGGEKVATKVLGLIGPGGLLLTGADWLGLAVATRGEEAAAVAGEPNGLTAGCGFLPATASHVTPASTTTTVVSTSERRGRDHRAGS